MQLTIRRKYVTLSLGVFHLEWQTLDFLPHLSVTWKDIRRSWMWDHRRWHLIHVEQRTPTWWRTLFYDGYYQGDWVTLPEGKTWQSGKKVWIEWPPEVSP